MRGRRTYGAFGKIEKLGDTWDIDATDCVIDEGNAAVFVVVDHSTSESLGVPSCVARDSSR